MPVEQQPTPQIGDPGMDPTSEAGPGSGNVGIFGIVALTTYLVLFTLFLIYALIVVWPVPTPSGQPDDAKAAPSPSSTAKPVTAGTPAPRQTAAATAAATATPTPTPTPIETGTLARESSQAGPSPSPGASPPPTPKTFVFLGRQFKLWDEQQLILLVLLAGALGSILHSLRSVYWYIGNRSLVRSWLAMYIVLPFAGSTLALIFYLVIRGGFFSPQSNFQQTSPFGFAAFAALIGMFSPQAVLKLREVAETLLSKPQAGANSKPQATMNPGTVTTPPAVPANKPPIPPTGENPVVEG
jgi:hypothetical protein